MRNAVPDAENCLEYFGLMEGAVLALGRSPKSLIDLFNILRA